MPRKACKTWCWGADPFTDVLQSPYGLPINFVLCNKQSGKIRCMDINLKQPSRRNSDASSANSFQRSETIRRLNENLALFRAVFKNVVVGILYTDGKGFIKGFNPAAETILGRPNIEAVGKHIHEVIVPYCRREYEDGIFRHLQSQAAAPAQGPLIMDVRLPDGGSVPVDLITHESLTREGSIITVFIRDISEATIAEKKLRIAIAHAENATAAKSRYLSTMSHEIRTPLNAVLGSLDLLAECSLVDEQRRLLEAAQLSGRAVKNLTDDILDMATIESGHLILSRSPFNLMELIEDTAHAVAPGAYRKGLEISLNADADVPFYVVGDKRRLQQVLFNFLANAIKFTTDGAITLRLETLKVRSGSVDIRFWVSDTGIGIPNSSQGRLFQEFFRGDILNSGEFAGSGLGLAISKALVTAMDGDVGMESCGDAGSQFWFSANLGVDDTKNQPISSTNKLDPGHCVIVQTNQFAANVIRRQLMIWGRKAVVIGCAQHAINFIAIERRHGRLVTDVYIDIEEAEKYADEWLNISAQEYAPSIALLVRPDTKDLKQICEMIGPSVCLAKPIRITELWLYNSQKNIFKYSQKYRDVCATLNGLKQLSESSVTFGARILLAEDSDVNQMVVKSMLESVDYVVDVVSNGAEAVTAASASSYDLILMDLVMPKKDGLQATALIRQELKSSCPPIIAMTGNAFDDDRKRCMQAGMKDFLVKPVDKRQLIGSVAAVLNESAGRETEIKIAEQDCVVELREPKDPSQDNSTINKQVLSQLRAQVGDSTARSIVRQFIIESTELITQIVNYNSERDARKLAAHTLKSTAATFGLNKMHSVAEEIEQAFEANDSRRIAILTQDLQRRSRLMFKELQDQFVPVQASGNDRDIIKMKCPN